MYMQNALHHILLRVALFITVLNIPGVHYPMHLALFKCFNLLPADAPLNNNRRYYWGALYALSEACLMMIKAKPQLFWLDRKFWPGLPAVAGKFCPVSSGCPADRQEKIPVLSRAPCKF
jgi:hypothetical protein